MKYKEYQPSQEKARNHTLADAAPQLIGEPQPKARRADK
jgi:hypothetical protein